MIIAASVFALVLLLPPAPIQLDTSAWGDLAKRTVAGAYHVHTTRSDGAADKIGVAAAAARAGLRFVIFTDHGDGTRPPDPPAYVNGVLALDAVEISTDDGHYVAIDMKRAPYPLGGAAAAVVEDVARLGGFGVAAHPDSLKPALRWTDQTAPIDGIEWLNADSEWRNEGRGGLLRAGLTYWFRPAPALVTLLDRPVTLDRWDTLTRSHQVTALAGLDAHGGIGRRTEEGTRSGIFGIPSYEASFRAFSTRVVLERPLTGDPAQDARLVYTAIRTGRVFSAIDGLAGPALLDYRAEAEGGLRIEMGGAVPLGVRATLLARASLPPGAQLVLLQAGREVARGTESVSWTPGEAAGAFRVEAHTTHAPGEPPIPWLIGNPIYVGVPAAAPAALQALPVATPITAPPLPWHIEKDTTSSGVLRTVGTEVDLEYQLGAGNRHSQFVAIGTDTPKAAFSAVDLTLAADRPTRVSLQARGPAAARWGRSVYVDSTARRIRVPLQSLRAIEDAAATDPLRPELLSTVLLVIDLTNAAPGRSGTVRVLSTELVK